MAADSEASYVAGLIQRVGRLQSAWRYDPLAHRDELAWALSDVALFEAVRGDSLRAIDGMQRAVGLLRDAVEGGSAIPLEHRDLSLLLDNLATILDHLKRPEEALEASDEAVEREIAAIRAGHSVGPPDGDVLRLLRLNRDAILHEFEYKPPVEDPRPG